MVNSSDFIERLENLLNYYNLNASAFADKIQVQRSSISHLLSGRNKPSLEFVLKVVKNYPEVNLYWLLKGKGTFPSEDAIEEIIEKDVEDTGRKDNTDSTSAEPNTATVRNSATAVTANSNTSTSIEKTDAEQKAHIAQKSINKIVIFYSDGSFEAYDA